LRVRTNGNIDSSTRASYMYGLSFEGNTHEEMMTLSGQSLAGRALGLGTYASGGDPGSQLADTVGDPKVIYWGGDAVHDESWIGPAGGTYATSGFVVSAAHPKLRLQTINNPGLGVTLDATGVTQSRTLTVPDVTGTLLAPPGGSNIVRTLPTNTSSTVNIGSFTSNYGTSSLELWICDDSGECGRYMLQAEVYDASAGQWQIVAPFGMTNVAGNSFAVQLEAQASYAAGTPTNLRLRNRTSNAYTVRMTVLNFGPNMAFTPDAAVNTNVPVPTGVWGNTVLTQYQNKLLLTNGANVAATIDPSGITANRTFTMPDLDGTAALSNFPEGSGSAPALTATSCSGAVIGAGSTNWAGSITGLPAGSCSIVMTFASATAAHDWSCQFSNSVTPSNLFVQSNASASTTTATVSGVSASGDRLRYICVAF